MTRHWTRLAAVLVLSLLPTLGAAVAHTGVDVTAVVEGNTAFAVDLYHALRETEGNLFFSPLSISTALAMTYAGARGQTEREMASVLRFSLEQSVLHPAFASFQTRLRAVEEEGPARLGLANSLWCQRDHPLLESFLSLTRAHYGAALRFVDFAGETEAARLAINTWAREQTKEKIEELIKPGVLDPTTTLTLCNAVYFKGDWVRCFHRNGTYEADFFVGRDRTVRVSMMSQMTDARWKRYDNLTTFELPYAGDDLAMVVLLPSDVDGLGRLEESLTEGTVRGWLRELDQAEPSEVSIRLPKFRTTCDFELAETLAGMGMPSAFRNADFSGMTGDRSLFISNVIHKACVEVTEEGTEAAAATAVSLKRGGPVIHVNHPFVYLIQEKGTGTILFLGRIVDPSL